MTRRDNEPFLSLGNALAIARDEGTLTTDEFAPLAGALGTWIVTGQMPLEGYTEIHRALGRVVESVFSAPKGGASLGGQGVALGNHLESVGQMWSQVGLTDEALKRVSALFERVFDLGSVAFDDEGGLVAPLEVTTAELIEGLRASGVTIHSYKEELPNAPVFGVLTDENRECELPCIILGWGGRKTALQLGAASDQ
jgi:hypothetical protein